MRSQICVDLIAIHFEREKRGRMLPSQASLHSHQLTVQQQCSSSGPACPACGIPHNTTQEGAKHRTDTSTHTLVIEMFVPFSHLTTRAWRDFSTPVHRQRPSGLHHLMPFRNPMQTIQNCLCAYPASIAFFPFPLQQPCLSPLRRNQSAHRRHRQPFHRPNLHGMAFACLGSQRILKLTYAQFLQ